MSIDPEGAARTAGPIPVCPRHPDRESYVRCQRCERPVCPDCQRPAAVGIQCVDCVREQAKTVRMPRTVFGGVWGQATAPVATQVLIALNVVVYVVQRAVPRVTDDLSFTPIFSTSEPWRFLTGAFLHSQSDVFHILLNMLALWVTGSALEPLLGRIRFVGLYLVSALGANVGYLLLANPDFSVSDAWYTQVVGASGAVFGLFAAMFVTDRRLNRPSSFALSLIVISVLFSFRPGIAWQGHLGGAITGLLVTAVLAYAPRGKNQVRAQAAGIAGVVLLLVLLVAVKIATLPVGVPT